MLRIIVRAVVAASLVPTAVHAGNGAGNRSAPAATDFRVHADVPAAPKAIVDAPGGKVRSGFGGSLIALYPSRTSGFHLSAGGRLFGRAGRPRVGESDTDRLLAMPRGSGLGGRGGRRRPSPAMLVGVDGTVAQGLTVGVDGGTAMGRLYSAPGRPGRLQSGRSGGGAAAGGLNEIGRVTMLYRF